MSKSEKSSLNKQPTPRYGYQNKHSSYKHYGKKSVHKHKKISSMKDNEQSHSDDESYFVNTIQDEEARDTCVKLRFAGARRGISASIDTGAGISVLPNRVYRMVFPHVNIQPTNIKLSAYKTTLQLMLWGKLRYHVNITMRGNH